MFPRTGSVQPPPGSVRRRGKFSERNAGRLQLVHLHVVPAAHGDRGRLPGARRPPAGAAVPHRELVAQRRRPRAPGQRRQLFRAPEPHALHVNPNDSGREQRSAERERPFQRREAAVGPLGAAARGEEQQRPRV